MKRFIRTTLSAIVGLGLGWYVAGMVPGLTVSRAEGVDRPSVHHSSEHQADGSEHDAHSGDLGDGGHRADSAGHDGHDAAPNVAPGLVPGSGHTPWFRSVLAVVAGLFVAAVVLGIPAVKLRGPEPAEPVIDHGH